MAFVEGKIPLLYFLGWCGFIVIQYSFFCRADRIDNGISAYENSERIKNITIALQNVLDNSSNYDIRLRPRFGGWKETSVGEMNILNDLAELNYPNYCVFGIVDVMQKGTKARKVYHHTP